MATSMRALGRAAAVGARHPLISADPMRPETLGFAPTSRQATQRIAVLLERRALVAMATSAEQMGLSPSISRNDEILLTAVAGVDRAAIGDALAGAASNVLGAPSASASPPSHGQSNAPARAGGKVAPLPPASHYYNV